MNILGISAFYHDSSAALFQRGKVVAVEEERFSGLKHESRWPAAAIDHLLTESGLQWSDIDLVCFYENPEAKHDRIMRGFNSNPLLTACSRLRYLWKYKVTGETDFRRRLKAAGYSGKTEVVNHHLSHAALSYYTSAYDEALVVVVDAVGERESVAIYHGFGDNLVLIKTIDFPNSAGMFYSTFTAYLGFAPNEGEYKVMGLSAYGDADVYYERLRDLIVLNDDGFEIDQQHFNWETSDVLFKSSLIDYLGIGPRIPSDEVGAQHAHLAAAVQRVYEEIFMHVVRIGSSAVGYRCQNICLGGGSAYNGLANNRCYEEFDSVWVPFAPSDAGSSIGACLATIQKKHQIPPYLGPAYGDIEIKNLLDSLGLLYKEADEDQMINMVANDIANCRTVAVFRDRMEFGARALGNRSILASATDPGMKDRINSLIKKREGFRPFAPSVVVQDADKYFDIKEPVPYMNQVLKVLDSGIPAVTHVDMTARVQTVSETENKYYWKLLRRVGELTGYPMCLNTSFNFKDQTITRTPEEAIDRFFDSDLDALVLGSFYLKKEI